MKKSVKALLIAVLVVLATVIAGCGSKGDKYVGDWMREYDGLSGSPQIEHLTIKKQGDGFIITRTLDGLAPKGNTFSGEWVWQTGMAKNNFTGEFKDDILSIKILGQSVPLELDKNGESISLQNDKYFKKFDSEAIKKKAEETRDRSNARMQQYQKTYSGKQLTRK